MEPISTLTGAPDLAGLDLLQQGGIDPLELFADLADQDALKASLGTREDAPSADDLRLKLSEQQLTDLAKELDEICTEYERAMDRRYRGWEEIQDGYAMVPEAVHGGSHQGASQLVSELMRSLVDQAAARLERSINGATPRIRVTAILGSVFGDQTTGDQMASATETVLNEYTDREMRFAYRIPQICLRTPKLGTTVIRLQWEEREEKRTVYTDRSREPQTEQKKVGRLVAELVDNRSVIIWPPTLVDWQEDPIVVGHSTIHTPTSWRQVVRTYKLSEEVAKEIEAHQSDLSKDPKAGELRRAGIEPMTQEDLRALKPITMTELWCNYVLPGEDSPRKFHVILHRDSKKIAYIGDNPLFTGKHPYHPVRWKLLDGVAWGDGIGHDILQLWAADSALMNLEVDNLFAGAYWVVLRKAGSMYDTATDEPRPGMQIPVDNMEDFKTMKLGGEAPEIGAARQEVLRRAHQAAGIPPVMMGQGDPTMKSGAGTGSTLALIEQGNQLLASRDATFRGDFSALYMSILEMLAQYAPDGLYYRFASQGDAEKARLLKYTPPRGAPMSEIFSLRATAPSAATTNEARKQGYWMIWGIALQHIQVVDAMVTELLTQQNPAALTRWKAEVITYLQQINRKVVEFQEMPGIVEYIPELPEATSQDETINQQQQQMAEMQAQLQQAQQMLSQLAQTGAGMAGGPPGMPPPGGQGMGQMGQMSMPPMMAAPGGGDGMVA
jgi:hypothetical protein